MKVKAMKKSAKAIAAMAVSALMLTPAQAENINLTLDGSKGKLAAIIQKPAAAPGEKMPMVIIMHGFTGRKNERMLENIADKLEAKGVASIRFDFNGHGESEGDFQYMTVPNEVEDALKVYEYVRALDYVNTVSVLGHSQGGVVASMVAGQLGPEIKSAVLMAPAAVLRDDAIRGNTMGRTYNPLDPPEFVEMFGGKKLGRDYITTAFSLPIYETAAQFKGALCVIHGTGDQVVPYTYGIRYAQQSPNAELYIFPAEDHGFMKDMNRATDTAVDFLLRNIK